MTNWQELEQKYIMRTAARLPVTFVKGKGARLWDDTGREYLDFISGWAVDCIGHAHPVIQKALAEQAGLLLQVSNQFYTIPQIQLAELLVKSSCFNKVFFCNSGAEANEGAVKLARRYGQKHLNGAYEVITTFNSFHGRTLAMTAATGQAKFQFPYLPLPVGFINVEYNNINAIMAATNDRTCALMLEPVQGEGGVNVPTDDYLAKVREWCDKKGIVFIADEVQTGIGRLGTLFGYQSFGVEPDIMTLAKGLGGGVVIGAFLAKDKFCVFEPGEHGTTFGGNPLATAGSYAVIDYVIKNDISGNAARVGQYLMSRLKELKEKFKFITEVRGRGLLVAMQFNSDIAENVTKGCLNKGLIVNRVKPNALRFMPPLIITNGDVDEAIKILGEVLAEQK